MSEMKTYFQMISELKGYEPKSRMFTSEDEIQMLNKHFGLEAMSVTELQNLRDMFVLLYRDQIDMFSTNAMMSVTAVIDHFKWQKGGAL